MNSVTFIDLWFRAMTSMTGQKLSYSCFFGEFMQTCLSCTNKVVFFFFYLFTSYLLRADTAHAWLNRPDYIPVSQEVLRLYHTWSKSMPLCYSRVKVQRNNSTLSYAMVGKNPNRRRSIFSRFDLPPILYTTRCQRSDAQKESPTETTLHDFMCIMTLDDVFGRDVTAGSLSKRRSSRRRQKTTNLMWECESEVTKLCPRLTATRVWRGQFAVGQVI